MPQKLFYAHEAWLSIELEIYFMEISWVDEIFWQVYSGFSAFLQNWFQLKRQPTGIRRTLCVSQKLKKKRKKNENELNKLQIKSVYPTKHSAENVNGQMGS